MDVFNTQALKSCAEWEALWALHPHALKVPATPNVVRASLFTYAHTEHRLLSS